ncbi:MAG TPA: T9SS type A sorting domain-containing protein, partial [Flavisolibacter sp.]|nr:T9SS type A sorting domain-containing protein [Flavisolibacter sp.]
GTATDPDGSISAYLWTKISGPATFNIVNAASAQTTVQNLTPGTYQFELKATDNNGATAKDTMNVVVLAAPPPANIPPVAHAGADQLITLPTNSVNLNGIGADADGTVVGYTWTKISGPGQYGISAPGQALTIVNNLVEGVYKFELKVTDNQGAVGRDTMTVTVNGAPVRNTSTASLYPNPATTVINVRIDAITHRNQTDLRIYDSKGVLVYEEVFLRTTQLMVKEVDVSKLEKGVYFVAVNVDINNELTLKFVKE